jgi:MFS family permease
VKTQKKRGLNALRVYFERINQFSRNARLYLVGITFSGIGIGVYRLLFNFYVLSLGYDERFLGQLITVSSLTALIAAFPMGYLSDILQRKAAMILGTSGTAVAVVVMLLFPSRAIFITMNILLGMSQSLKQISMGPFVVENSGAAERTYLYSISMGLMNTAHFVGNWVGGYLPKWMGLWRNVAFTATPAYAWALTIAAVGALMAAVPYLFLRNRLTGKEALEQERSLFAPLQYFKENPVLLGKLILPTLLISMGAGLVMPFMNVYFRNVHGQSDAVIGTIFAWGSAATALGMLIAPVMADRFGKIQVVAVTQGLAIPFLAILGFVPVFQLVVMAYFIRIALMNMTTPIYQTFALEQIQPSARGMVASLNSMAWSFGWAFSPVISGWLQVRYGFPPAFAGTMILYAMAVSLYWLFFLRKKNTAPVTA